MNDAVGEQRAGRVNRQQPHPPIRWSGKRQTRHPRRETQDRHDPQTHFKRRRVDVAVLPLVQHCPRVVEPLGRRQFEHRHPQAQGNQSPADPALGPGQRRHHVPQARQQPEDRPRLGAHQKLAPVNERLAVTLADVALVLPRHQRLPQRAQSGEVESETRIKQGDQQEAHPERGDHVRVAVTLRRDGGSEARKQRRGRQRVGPEQFGLVLGGS